MLDRSKAGVLFPPVNKCMYWFNGKHYDQDGNVRDFETGDILEKAPPKVVKGPDKGPEPLPPTRPPAKQLGGETKVSDAAIAESEAIDLKAWASGKKVYKVGFFTIRKAVSDKYGTMPKNADEARKIIAKG